MIGNYLCLPEIKGQSKDPQHLNWIVINSFRQAGFFQSVEFFFETSPDNRLVSQLYRAHMVGQKFPEVLLEVHLGKGQVSYFSMVDCVMTTLTVRGDVLEFSILARSVKTGRGKHSFGTLPRGLPATRGISPRGAGP